MTPEQIDGYLKRIPVLEQKLDRVLGILDQIIATGDIDGIIMQDGYIEFDPQVQERRRMMREELARREREIEQLRREADELRRELE